MFAREASVFVVIVALTSCFQPTSRDGSLEPDREFCAAVFGAGDNEECVEPEDCEPDGATCFSYGTECETGHEQHQPTAHPFYECAASPDKTCDPNEDLRLTCLSEYACAPLNGECQITGAPVPIADGVEECQTIDGGGGNPMP